MFLLQEQPEIQGKHSSMWGTRVIPVQLLLAKCSLQLLETRYRALAKDEGEGSKGINKQAVLPAAAAV